jgi:hypothetical protein
MASSQGLQLRTNYLVPFFHNNTRTEFRIQSDDKVVLTNMRLCDFGISDFDSDANDLAYARSAGLYALIKNIYLYSGSVLVDQMRDCSKYMGIKNAKATSADMYDLNQQLLCSNNVLETFQITDPQHPDQVEMNINDQKLIGRVPLSQIFALLRATDTFNMWNDLRLVIEYNTNSVEIFQTELPNSWTINTPLLGYDELVVDEAGRDAMMKQGRAITLVYSQTERERWYVPQGASYYSQRLRAFDSKTLSSVVVQTKLPNVPDQYLANNYSLAVDGEAINLVVNGKKLLPYTGCSTPNMKLAMFNDSFGQVVSFTGEADSIDTDQAELDNIYGPIAQELLGRFSFFGCDVLNKINTLDVEYSRNTAIAGNTVEFELWMFGQVQMYLKKDATGRIMTGYV